MEVQFRFPTICILLNQNVEHRHTNLLGTPEGLHILLALIFLLHTRHSCLLPLQNNLLVVHTVQGQNFVV